MFFGIPTTDRADYLMYFDKLPETLKEYALPIKWVDIEETLHKFGIKNLEDVTIIDEDSNTITVLANGRQYTMKKEYKHMWRVGFIVLDRIEPHQKIVKVPQGENLYFVLEE